MKRPILLLIVLPFLALDVAKSRAIRIATRLGWGHP